MSKFAELLKAPLPSKSGPEIVNESAPGEDFSQSKKEREEEVGGSIVKPADHTIEADLDPTAEGGMKDEGNVKSGEIAEKITPVNPDPVDDKQPVTSVNKNDPGSEKIPVDTSSDKIGGISESVEEKCCGGKGDCDGEGSCQKKECGDGFECGPTGFEAGCKEGKECGSVVEHDDEDIDDINLDDLSDADLDGLEEALKDADINDAIGDVEEVELTADEEREADDNMALAATAALLKDEFNAEEFASFMEKTDEVRKLVYEGFLMESDLGPEIPADGGVITEGTKKAFYNKTMVRFDKKARLAQLYAVAVNVSAASKNDPDYRKLKKIMKIRKMLRKKLALKYKGEATRRMKTYFKRLRASRSSTLNKIANDIEKESK